MHNTCNDRFFLAGFPEEHLLSPPGNYGQGFLDGRLKIRFEGENWSSEVHHVITMGSKAPTTQLEIELQNFGMELEDDSSGSFMTGVGLQAPEVIDVTLTITTKAVEMLEDAFGDDRTHALLVGVNSGGCSGYMYDLQIVETTTTDVQELEVEGFHELFAIHAHAGASKHTVCQLL